MRVRFIFLLSSGLLMACGSPPPDREPAAPEDTPGATPLIVHIDGLRLRAAAGPEAAVIGELPAGTRLYDLGEVSEFTTPLVLRGVPFDEPWLRVRTEEGRTGWVYAGALHFEWREDQTLPNRLMEMRLQTLFGPEGAARIQTYRRDFRSMTAVDDFARAYREGIALRERLVDHLEEHLRLQSQSELPNLFWLAEALPGFAPQLVAEGAAYYLFADYRQWLTRARQTTGSADDDFVELQLQVFSEDSIEYFFPVWTIQTRDYGGHSLLGRGHHRTLLRLIDRTLARDPFFQPEIDILKTQLINDITNADVTYWEDAPAIVRELEGIMADRPACLDREDRIALEGRLSHFRNPDAHGIVVNLKAG